MAKDSKIHSQLLKICIYDLDVGSRCWTRYRGRPLIYTQKKIKIALIDIYVCHMLKERLSHDMCRVKRPVGVYEILCLCSNRVLRLSDEMSVSVVHWDLALCLLLAWVMCYFCIWKGIKSTGKARNCEHV